MPSTVIRYGLNHDILFNTPAVGGDTPLHLACLGCLADDERSIGELLLAGVDADMCTPAGYKPRDLLLQTVPEQADHRATLLALLDRPMPKMTRVTADSVAAATTDTAVNAAAAAAAAENSSRGGQDVTSSFLDCISQLDIQRFKVLLGSHGLHHSRPADGATLLHLCSQCGFLQGVTLLLQSKCPMRLDLHGCTALHHAAAANQPLIASELLCAFPSSLGMCNDGGDTAFITAIRAQAPAVVAVLTAVPAGSSSRVATLAKALLTPGAEGLPPLHLSVKIGALRCAELLLSAQPSHANLHTPTVPRPLHVVAASSSNFAEGAARLLLQAGADVTAADSKGLTAADVAEGTGNVSLARILRNVASAVADLASLKVAAL
jgi:ankyrin repeat protein